MNMQPNLEETVARIKTDTSEIKMALASQTGLLHADQELLKKILAAVTPEEGVDGGVPLDELLAELIMEMRDQGQKLTLILGILNGQQPPNRDATKLSAVSTSLPRGGRP
jgi:hypothetical protein